MKPTLLSRTWLRAAEALRSSVNIKYLATQALIWVAGYFALWVVNKAFTVQAAGNIPTVIGIALSLLLIAALTSSALLSTLDETSGSGLQLESLIPDLISTLRILPLLLTSFVLVVLLDTGSSLSAWIIVSLLSVPLPLAIFAAADSSRPAIAQLKRWWFTLLSHPLDVLLQWFIIMFLFTLLLFLFSFPPLLIMALPFATLFSAVTYRDLHGF